MTRWEETWRDNLSNSVYTTGLPRRLSGKWAIGTGRVILCAARHCGRPRRRDVTRATDDRRGRPASAAQTQDPSRCAAQLCGVSYIRRTRCDIMQQQLLCRCDSIADTTCRLSDRNALYRLCIFITHCSDRNYAEKRKLMSR